MPGKLVKAKETNDSNVYVSRHDEQVALAVEDGRTGSTPLPVYKGFKIPEYDDVVLTYTGDNLTTVIYKLLTVTVATLTLTYTGARLDRVELS